MNERNENIEGTAETQACDLGVKTKVILTKNADFFGRGCFIFCSILMRKERFMQHPKRWECLILNAGSF